VFRFILYILFYHVTSDQIEITVQHVLNHIL